MSDYQNLVKFVEANWSKHEIKKDHVDLFLYNHKTPIHVFTVDEAKIVLGYPR